MLIYFVCIFMFYFGMMMFFLKKKHVLMLLLSLEFMALVILLMMINFLTVFLYDVSIIMYFIIVLVCEAVMGLVLLTLLVRVHGSDYIKSTVMFMC